MASVGDLSSWSDELAADTAWPLSYFFSPARANVLRGLPLPVGGLVLEIGSRAGAVTRYLGEEALLLDALEPDPAMAEIAAARCSGLDNVAVFSAWVDEVPVTAVYDLVVAIDVLGELEQRQVTLEHFLTECRDLLKPGGVLILGADNADGVRRRAGGLTPPVGISSPHRPAWLSLDDLRAAVTDSGLQASVLSAFPDHRLTKVMFDADALASVDPHLVADLPSFPSPSYGAPILESELEGALWRSLVHAGQGKNHANSFVALISDAEPPPTAAATYWSMGRAAALSACNRIVALDDGDVVVERRAAFPRAGHADGPLRLRTHTEPYVRGPSLVDLIASADSARQAHAILGRWTTLVENAALEGDVPWDLIARNVIVDATDCLRPIDQEWELSGATVSTVLRRGIFWLASDLLAASVTPPWLRGRTHGQVADFLWWLTGHHGDGEWLAAFVAEEAHSTSFVSPLRPPRSRVHIERQNGRILSAISKSPTEPTSLAADPTVDDDAPSLQAVVDSLLAVNEQLRTQLEELERQRRHDALTQRDHVIGVTAELEVMRDRVTRAQAGQKLAMTKVRRLRKQVADMQASLTWRVGRRVVRPLARLKGRR
nr:class I SAM-dependent methyltransferase [Aeromicrobium sp. CFBP 8757]